MAETKTARVERTIREWVGGGKLSPGDKMPSERTLTEELDIGRTALRQVLARLVAEGVLEVHGRSSYRVPAPSPTQRRVGVTSGELKPWQIYGERPLYDNRWVRLALVDVEPPGVKRFEHHVVRLQHVAVTAVLDDQDRVLMLWRYRFVPDQWGWELPGGIVDAGEDARTCAAREVEEETGWRPANLDHVVTYQPMVGMVDSPHEIFVAHGAEHVGEPTDAEEAGRVEWVPLTDIPDLMERGQLMGSGTLIALLHVLANRKNASTTSA
ncbi:NUDIX domain-containing protein [Streptomyces sp. NBC_01571]|uniref:NUDIX domain-containing protein n=1 Tax=Streptomyces sp. NBC_01571 TaxID=2975883 RepID=UPI00224D57E9|nr:NUDIX domain-containing protein [Streptomyces sp. NBC_01571]MCX4577347.1 NUDIX domain-containing protein [Streptomyces sp. NBC_01571]